MTEEHPVRVLGRRLDAARRQRGWTFREFAKHTGMSKSTLQYLVGTRRTAPDYYELVGLLDKLGEPWTQEWERLWRNAVCPARSARPAQLPADVHGFAGRVAELSELDRVRAEGGSLALLCGTAGVGKTALALRWAHRIREAFPDGQLYVDLRGYDPDPPVAPADALAGFLRALGVEGAALPSTVDDRAALYRTLMHGRRMVVLLDNASSVEQVRPLIPGSGSCFLLVTGREALSGLVARDGARRVELHPLPLDDAARLLNALIGTRAAADPDAVAALAEQCARLPLALRVAAEFVAGRPGTPLAGLATQLGDEQRRLDALDAGGDPRTMVRGVLSWSYRHLPEPVARAFRLLGLHRGNGFGPGAAAALTGLRPADLRSLLDQLCRAYLVRPSGPDRYHMHELLHAYAAELARTVESGQSRRAAVRRLLDYYLHSAHAANRCLEPHRLPITLPRTRSAIVAERFRDTGEALAWFAAEHAALLAVIEVSIRSGLDGHTWRLAWASMTFFERRGHWHDYMDTQRAALAATERLGEGPAQAHAHRCLARVFGLLGRDADAERHLRRALDLYEEAGDQGGQARTYLNLSATVERCGRPAEAMAYDRHALALYRAIGDRHGEGLALNQIGCDHLLIGEPREGLAHCEQALARFEEFSDGSSQAATWDSLGSIHCALGDSTRAATCYRSAIELYRRLGDRYREADSLVSLGRTLDAAGDRDSARARWREALRILTDLKHSRASEIRFALALRGRQG